METFGGELSVWTAGEGGGNGFEGLRDVAVAFFGEVWVGVRHRTGVAEISGFGEWEEGGGHGRVEIEVGVAIGLEVWVSDARAVAAPAVAVSFGKNFVEGRGVVRSRWRIRIGEA